jgi:hypothetical protein
MGANRTGAEDVTMTPDQTQEPWREAFGAYVAKGLDDVEECADLLGRPRPVMRGFRAGYRAASSRSEAEIEGLRNELAALRSDHAARALKESES